METYTAEQLMAGFAAFTTPGEVAASPSEGEQVSITVTQTPTFPCLSGSCITTLDAGC